MTRILVSLAVLLWPVTLVAQDPAAGLTGQPPIQQMTPAGGPSVAVDVAAQDAVHQGALQGPAGLWSGILAYYADLRNAVLYAINEGAQDHMSPVGMFMAADWVVKAVMLSLAFASVLTWAIFVGKMVSLALRRRAIARQYRDLERAGTLRAMPLRMKSGKGVVGRMAHAALAEWEGTGHRQELHAGIKERTGSVLGRIEVGAARRLGVGTGILANIGATAPFVGLFGTVWGIMNSFISIAQSNTTNLAVVAPGIAEALLATAIGLVAAIPAVIFYNLITRGLGGYRVMLGDAAALVERTLSRDLDLLPGTSGGTPEMPVKPVRQEPIRNMKPELPANETGLMAAAE